MEAKYFLDSLKKVGVDFYTGVPDSQLKPLCDEIYREQELGKTHIVAANEGGAVGLAAGHYLATGRPALVYMQNSGIGNALNPIASLSHEEVYKIPMIFVVGWRGEPGVKDEPQHIFQGMITKELMDILQIPYFILDTQTTEIEMTGYTNAVKAYMQKEQSVAFIVKKDTFSGNKAIYSNAYSIKREEALQAIIEQEVTPSVYIATTGKLSRELFELRKQAGEGHTKDFLTVGSMGHASMIALGIALEKPEYRVWCLDGDGAALMHMGSMALLAHTRCENMVHVVFHNGAHETVGGMPVAYGKMDFAAAAKALGYQVVETAETLEELREAFSRIQCAKGPCFLEIKVSLASRANLGRPTNTPIENKQLFMKLLLPEDKPYGDV